MQTGAGRHPVSGMGRAQRLCLAAALAVAALALGAPAASQAAGTMAWGSNANGELGNETSAKSTTPVAVSGLGSGVKQISAGSAHALALLSNGTIKAWGANEYGQLATGGSSGPESCRFSEPCSTKPLAISGLSGVIAMAAGAGHSLALFSDGTVTAWGLNESGELGVDPATGPSKCGRYPFTQPCATKPTPVSGLSEVVAVSAERASLALLSSGKVMAWGNNEYGQLGNGSTSNTFTPTQVSGLSGAVEISAGTDHSLALLSDGTVMAWGLNNDGQLGNGSTTDSSTPVQVKNLHEVIAISAGGFHSLALLANGTVLAWGDDGNGQLGTTTSLEKCGSATCSKTPVAVAGVSGVSAISAGLAHSLALVSDGTVKSWGWNNEGQLGDGAIGENEPVPGPVVGLSGAALISAGGYYGMSYGPPQPNVTAVSPTTGPQSGGISVTISGTNFAFVNAVKFGSASATSYTVNSEESITAIAPPGSGTADVTVSNPGGTSATSFADQFTYLPAPTVASVSPSVGPQSGGTTVTITGTTFRSVTVVKFGFANATSYSVNSEGSITATSPPGIGTVDVTVTAAGGTSAPSASDRFTYLPPPAVTKVSPARGGRAGGTSVTITGSNLAYASAVYFGAAPAASFTVNSPTSITAVSPASSPGVVDVRVTTPGGTSAASKRDHFHFVGHH
jgi:alpha-tubulin suppressor-like RCC1 family protein